MTDNGKTVLIIDDDVTIRKLLNHHLSANNYRTLEAENAEKVLIGLNTITLILFCVT